MKSRNGLFLVTCMTIVAGLLLSYSRFVAYFGENGEDRFRAEAYAEQLREERFARDLADARLRDLTQEVAAALPADGRRKLAGNGYDLENLAAATRRPAAVPLTLSGPRLDSAKKLFAEKNYPASLKEFEKIVTDFPSSPSAVEAYFFIGESSYLTRNEAKVIETADLMVTQYPTHELTGFMLLRLGQINEQNSRVEEASEIYRTVAKNFTANAALVEQARRLSRALDLE